MYLSRVRVTTGGLTSRTLGQLLRGNAYANHQLLWRLFPDRRERPFLFRQELERETPGLEEPRGLPLFYVLSDQQPDDVTGLLDCECKPFTPRLRVGQRLSFRLRANPVVARRDEGSKHSRRHDVLMDAKISARREGVEDGTTVREKMDDSARQWLVERSSRGGYRLLATPQISGYRQHSYRRNGREIRFSSVDYQGSLEVADPERFLRTLKQGIGRARAFGCGMWMVRRI